MERKPSVLPELARFVRAAATLFLVVCLASARHRNRARPPFQPCVSCRRRLVIARANALETWSRSLGRSPVGPAPNVPRLAAPGSQKRPRPTGRRGSRSPSRVRPTDPRLPEATLARARPPRPSPGASRRRLTRASRPGLQHLGDEVDQGLLRLGHPHPAPHRADALDMVRATHVLILVASLDPQSRPTSLAVQASAQQALRVDLGVVRLGAATLLAGLLAIDVVQLAEPLLSLLPRLLVDDPRVGPIAKDLLVYRHRHLLGLPLELRSVLVPPASPSAPRSASKTSASRS